MPPDPYAPYPPSTYGAPPGLPPNDDTLAWVGVGTSVASWITCCCTPIPFLGMLMGLGGLALALAGLVCGIFAYRTATRTGGRTDLPIIAMVLGGARLLITVGFVVVAVVILGAAGVAGYFQQHGG